MTHLVKTYNYITFFPQIVAGPIVKGKAFYGQIRRKRLDDVRWWDAISALSQGYFLSLEQLSRHHRRYPHWLLSKLRLLETDAIDL